MSDELTRVALLRAILGARAAGVSLGIGDDAAILEPGVEPLVWTIDAAVEGVHFRRDFLSMEDLGWRATMAAASDLAAVGAEPAGILAALTLPDDFQDSDLERLARGQRAAADALGTAVAGGNLARGQLAITTTVLGRAARPLRRDGARAGDAIHLAGPVGLAGAGLAALLAGRDEPDAIAAWRRPTARIAAGRAASAAATAAIDVSDGLARDAGHVARASAITIVLDADAIVGDALRAAAARLGRDALDLALGGGEDYALLVAAPPGAELAGFTRIGWCEAAGAHGAVALSRGGAIEPVEATGFDHFG